ncbi:MAG: hypothetical protein FJ288_12210 [Planctomycetes bacterium]|nr:hypothetical protein [Planctomycetota bacterium]
MKIPRIVAAICLLIGASWVAGQESLLVNPTKRQYADEAVRLLTPAPGPAGSFVVKEDGAEAPYQVEEIGGSNWIWVCSSFDPGASHKYQVAPGRPVRATPRIAVRREGGIYVLDNGLVAVKVPAEAAGGVPGPISAVKLGDRWVGASAWKTSLPLKKFTAAVVGDGTVLARVRLLYEFDGKAGLDGNLPAFAEVDVAVGPGWSHAEIFERHEMARGDFWEFEISNGWSPTQGLSKPFSGGAGSGLVAGKVEPNRPLKPGGLPYQREDLFINLFPRWNQHYKDGWYFAAADGTNYVGAVVVRAGQWVWPHSNAIEAVVRSSGDYAGLRAPTWKGRRLWWLVAPTLNPCSIDYVTRYAWEGLDKLNHDFLLDWPGKKGSFAGMNFYDGGQMNPTGGIRGAGRRAIADAGKSGDISTLARVQVMMHPDAYGTYWNFWSPENPNFFTDFTRVPIALTAGLKAHPRFEQFRRAAEAKLREDVYHSITMPGGAGQECPGYVGYALRNWTELAAVCRQHLGFDPTAWDRFKAAQYFQKRITQPDGALRRTLPMGDTHPAKEGGPAIVDVPADEVRKFATEELPGFGVIFSSRPGTPEETYLAFKSGPNRGHYHGDQLAFHYCAAAKPLAVDHHCSYHPRAGQEHMHNRLAFHTDEFPYANMDGYERLIAFKTSPQADIAVGQVESERLRQVEKLPPEIWHQEYPQHAFAKPLIYRRTVVFVKGGQQDYFVVRDQFWASEPLAATYCLHVLADAVRREGPRVDFGRLTVVCIEPEKFDFEPFPWSHENGGLESTQGARLTVRGDEGRFITVLYPGAAPAVSAVPGGVKVGADEIVFAGDRPAAGDAAKVVTVRHNGREALSLAGAEINLDRSQGEIGLFVPDAGYPFGEIPDWLIRQRAKRPDWAK